MSTVSERGRSIIKTKLKSTKNKLKIMREYCTKVNAKIKDDVASLNCTKDLLEQELAQLNATQNPTNLTTANAVVDSANDKDMPKPTDTAESNTNIATQPELATITASLIARFPVPANLNKLAAKNLERARINKELTMVEQRLTIAKEKLKLMTKTLKQLRKLETERRDIRNEFNGIIHLDFETNHNHLL